MSADDLRDIFKSQPEVAQELIASVEGAGAVIFHSTKVTGGAGNTWYIMSLRLRDAAKEATASVHINPYDVEGTRKSLYGNVNRLRDLAR